MYKKVQELDSIDPKNNTNFYFSTNKSQGYIGREI